ncbi:hypothetical protein [Hydrogenophaga sp. NFH-34]|uniref:hypothetical protein n=1 Tax=Hydrogenophaga sp. NFH-34 TaxID=2744446 RepID=UPI003FA387F3
MPSVFSLSLLSMTWRSGAWCLLALMAWALLAGCTSTPAPRGEVQPEPMASGELAQSDVNRMATLGMRDNLASLFLLMDKLYRRNPQEWRKGGFSSREAAMDAVRQALEARRSWPDLALADKRDIAALAVALDPAFAGDRVAAFTYGLGDMLITAHGGKTRFYLLDGLDAQALYNAARNIEIAAWMLAQRRDRAGRPLLLADEITAQARNLSFEREFGKMIARVDLLASVTTEKYRRAVVSYVQNFVGGTLLQFLPVQAVTAP